MRTKMILAASAAMAALSSPAHAQVEGWFKASTENLCVLDAKKGNSPSVSLPGGFRFSLDDVKTTFQSTVPQSRICTAPSQEARLLLTSMMLDHAALSAAKGMDAAQQALGIKRSFETEIVTLERALEGLGTGGSDVSVVMIESASKQIPEVEARLKELEANNALDDTARQKLVEARDHLRDVDYYSVNFAVGAKLLADYFTSPQGQNPQAVMATVSRVGMQSDFYTRVASQASSFGGNFSNITGLRGVINKVKKVSKEPKDADQRARAQAEKAANLVDEKIKGFSVTPA